MTIPIYIQGSDLPDLAITWLDEDGDVIDFSSLYTFEMRVGVPGSAATVVKTDGITGAASEPNVLIGWATSGELNTLTPATYTCDLRATRTSDNKQRIMRFKLRVTAAVGAAA